MERIRSMVKKFQFDVICLAEPLVKPKTDSILKMGLPDYDECFFHNDEVDRTGNLWILYKRGLQINLVHASRQQITIEVEGVVMPFVHAHSLMLHRRQLWAELVAMKTDLPWLVRRLQNRGPKLLVRKGRETSMRPAMEEFHNMINDCCLMQANSWAKLSLGVIIKKFEPANSVYALTAIPLTMLEP
ncbi:hypothetical protein IFM89_025716 [Coptis chinensis]|uniref:Uncharacterized protein n=1 Tax=Coptis chinensis TaxID=261450 RepID=A0A835HGV2_9MAGN|nr:hypothetical protein IFM89_025716 [Coptis chinensis]